MERAYSCTIEGTKRCPIQIVESKSGEGIWITLNSLIEFGEFNDGGRTYFGRFKSLVAFNRNYSQSILQALSGTGVPSNIVADDLIRNPTVEEMSIIDSHLRKKGYRFNKKTLKFIKIN
jgi:hypothetical protein